MISTTSCRHTAHASSAHHEAPDNPLPSGERLPLATIRQLIAEQKAPTIDQPALFELRTDARPAGDRNAAERYAAPSLFSYAPKEPSP